MATNRIKDVIDAEINGQIRMYSWRKAPSQITPAGLWFDLSMSSGNPPPKYWFDATPLVAKAVYQSTDGGFYHGDNVSPMTKYLRLMTAMTITPTGLPLTMYLCDYLLYYPSIDDGTTAEQLMTNTVTLPRYTDGDGVQMIAVSIASRAGGQQFYVTYTNSDGVSGRVSQTCTQNTSAALGTICTSASATRASGNPYIGLQDGDSGVRSVESVTMLGTDVGLFSIILVKPLGSIAIRGIDAPVEKDFYLMSNELTEIKDNAFLNCLCLPQGALSSTALIGNIKCVFN